MLNRTGQWKIQVIFDETAPLTCVDFFCVQATSRRDRTHQRLPVTCCDSSNFRFRSLSWTVPCGEWRDLRASRVTLYDLELCLLFTSIDEDDCVQFVCDVVAALRTVHDVIITHNTIIWVCKHLRNPDADLRSDIDNQWWANPDSDLIYRSWLNHMRWFDLRTKDLNWKHLIWFELMWFDLWLHQIANCKY